MKSEINEVSVVINIIYLKKFQLPNGYRWGIEVCTEKGASDKDILEWVNAHNPRPEIKWNIVRRKKGHPDFRQLQCPKHEDREHLFVFEYEKSKLWNEADDRIPECE